MTPARPRRPRRVSEGRVAFDAARFLVDTHALIWWATLHPKLSARARSILSSDTRICLVSSVSVYELIAKHRAGKLGMVDAIAHNVLGYLDEQEFATHGLSARHAEVAGRLGGHRDPFDRLLAAQAIVDGLTIVSSDPVFDGWGVKRVW